MSAFVVHAANSGIPLVGLCTGSFILAELGLLDGYRCAVSWFHIHAFRERFPHIDSSAEALFMLDRDRATCSGGVGAADLAAHLVTADLGEQPAEKASRILLLDRIRGIRDLQPAEPYAHGRSTVVRRALRLVAGSLGPQPIRLVRAEAALTGRPLASAPLADLLAALGEEVDAAIPERASRPWKRQAIRGVGLDLIARLCGLSPRGAPFDEVS